MILTTVVLLASLFHSALPKVAKVEMEVTAYCPCTRCCGPNAQGITASGYVIQLNDKLVAAPRTIPFGTTLFIPGYGKTVVRDRGGAIKGNRLDVYFSSHQEALQWGRQKLIVTVFGSEKDAKTRKTVN